MRCAVLPNWLVCVSMLCTVPAYSYVADFPSMRFSPLLLSVVFIIASVVGLITGFSIHYIVGISLGVALVVLPSIFLFLIQYLLRRKDYRWSANVAQFLNRRLEILRFLLQVLFVNPYAHRRLKTHDMADCKKMKFVSKFLVPSWPRINYSFV